MRLSTKPCVSIVVVNFNTRDVAKDCIRSVLSETTKTSFRLIVVDNASTDGSAAAFRDEFGSAIELIALDENIGFARANNLAASVATDEFLLLLNPDTVVLDGAIDRLISFAMARPEAGIWGGRTLNGDGTLNPTSCWADMTVSSLALRLFGVSSVMPRSPVFNPEAYGGWERDSEREVDIVTGCFFLIRKELWDELRGFDPAFFMYGEEADLCVRARRVGARPTVTPDAAIIHFGGLSEQVAARKIEGLLLAKLSLALKHWSGWRKSMAKPLFLGLAATRTLGYSVAARVLRRKGLDDTAAAWLRVWSRRRLWLQGYHGDGATL